MTSETRPYRFVPEMLRLFRAQWWNFSDPYFRMNRRPVPLEKCWPADNAGRRDPTHHEAVLKRTYSKAALEEATAMVPEWFECADVPRPPQRIKPVSEGVVGRWYTNYWTLHSLKYQCNLAGVHWKHGERKQVRSNFEEPYFYVDFEESRAIREHRSRFINIHRSLGGMTKKVLEAQTEERYKVHKRNTDQYWSDRRIFLNRVRAMRVSGDEVDVNALPVKINFAAFEM
jgi:hypothetical protein